MRTVGRMNGGGGGSSGSLNDEETSRSDCCGEIKEQREEVKEDRLGRSGGGQEGDQREESEK